jgi:hypothetical protein
LSAQHPLPHAAARRPDLFAGYPVRRARALSTRGVAVVSARPLRLTPQSRMIKFAKRKRCMNSMSSAFPPSLQALWYSRRVHRGVSAKRAQESENGRRSRTILRGLGVGSYPLGRFWHAAITPTLCNKRIF